MTTHSITLPSAQSAIEICFHHSPRARKLSMRIDGHAHPETVIVTVPPMISHSQAMAFVQRHEAWIIERLKALPPRRFFTPEASISVFGRPYILSHAPHERGGVWFEGQEIRVSGELRYFARRVGDFLKAEARRHIPPLVHAKALSIDAKPGRIVIKDTRSRWGSCAANGDMTFSWRLSLAPDWVLDYVIAHEVAHLREMNHSKRFWTLAASLSPDIERAHHWLKQNGLALYRYG